MRYLICLALVAVAASASAAPFSPAAEKERAAVLGRWDASAKKDPARFAQLRETIEGYAERMLARQRREAPEVGRWGNTTEWRFRETGEVCLSLAVAALLPGSKHYGSLALIESVALGLDFLAANQSPEGRWHESDTNVDRFCLAPAAEAFLLLADRLPAERHAAWLEMIRRGGEYQFKNYYPRPGMFGSGHYPNMDAYFALTIALAGTICERPEWLRAAAEVTKRCGENCLLPGGAYEYVDGWNPVPVYQDIIPIILGRYYLLTGDAEAKRQLAATLEYYPRFSEVSGACDNGITPFIKHYWGYNGHAAAPEFTAWLTGDGRNRTVADRRMHWTGGGYWTALMPQWLNDTRPAALPTDFLVRNGDVEGFQMRSGGKFTAWITGRATAHDTLVSVMSSDPVAVPLQCQSLAAFLTEVTGLPQTVPVGATARFSFYREKDARNADREERIEAQPSGDWREMTGELLVPEGMRNLRLDLFMLFKPGTVVWDDVQLLDPEGRNLLPNAGFDRLSARGGPEGWSGSAWGTKGEARVLADAGNNAVLCRAASEAERASWSVTLEVTPGQKLRFRARTRTEGIPLAPAAEPLTYYLTDMKPRVQQLLSGPVAVQRLESGLHAMGNGVTYPTPVDNRWRWGCWRGGSPETAPWRVAQTWIAAGGRLYGMLSLRCVREGEGTAVGFRPIFTPERLPEVRLEDGRVMASFPRLALAAWPGDGLKALVDRPCHTLRVDVPDGAYEVEIVAGDADYPLLPMEVREGERTLARLQAEKGKCATTRARVTARDGHLSLSFLPAKGEHWKLAALVVRDGSGKEVRRFDAGPTGKAAAPGWTRLDGGMYSEARGFGWNRDLRSQERERTTGEWPARTLITAATPDGGGLAFQGKPGKWLPGQTYTLDVAVGPEEPQGAGKTWGFTGDLGGGLRGWWMRDGAAAVLVLSNEGEKAFAGDVRLPFTGRFRRVSGQDAAPRLEGATLRGVRVDAGGVILLRLE